MAARIFALDDIGDLTAPPGSPAWAKAIRLHLQRMLSQATTSVQAVRNYVAALERTHGYQHLDDAYGHPFPSLRAFATAKPPAGLGYDAEVLTSIAQETREMVLGDKVAEVQALRANGGDRRSQEFQCNDSNAEIRGNASAYRIARLKRDHPAIAAALAEGHFPSVHAAAKAAGLVHVPTPMETLARAWRKVSPQDRLRFLSETLTAEERQMIATSLMREETPHA